MLTNSFCVLMRFFMFLMIFFVMKFSRVGHSTSSIWLRILSWNTSFINVEVVHIKLLSLVFELFQSFLSITSSFRLWSRDMSRSVSGWRSFCHKLISFWRINCIFYWLLVDIIRRSCLRHTQNCIRFSNFSEFVNAWLMYLTCCIDIWMILLCFFSISSLNF